MSKRYEPEVGDVLTSDAFQYGYLDKRFPEGPSKRLNGIIMAGVTSIIDEERVSEDARVAAARSTGKVPPKVIKNSHYRNDGSRAEAQFVVIEKGHDHNSGDGGSSDADYVVVQRMRRNGTFDPKGELLWFYTNGNISASNFIEPRELKIDGHMEHWFR